MSIPKIIHYCWFGGGPISPESRKCIESWKKYCPDYKIIEWNEQNFEISQNRYAQQAYEAKKYAFVSDYVRLAVLYRYGGIYLDTDVELVRPLDELLEHKGFISMEHSAPSPYGRTLLVNTGSGVGAEPGCEMIGKMLAAYRNAAFIQETGEPDLRTCTQRDTPLFTKAGLQQKDEQQELDGFLVLPTDCFSPFDYVTERMHRTPRTFGIHYYQGSWQSGDKANRWRKRFKCTKVGRWCMWLRQCSPRWLREKRRSLHNRCRLQWKKWFGCRGAAIWPLHPAGQRAQAAAEQRLPGDAGRPGGERWAGVYHHRLFQPAEHRQRGLLQRRRGHQLPWKDRHRRKHPFRPRGEDL